MSQVIAGIDPGLKGGIACVHVDEGTLTALDMPTYSSKSKSGRNRNFVDAVELSGVFEMYDVSHVYLEKVHSMPTDGHVGAFTFGMGFGVIHGVVGALGLPLEQVTPQKWKAQLRVPANKKAAIERAHQLFPQCTDLLLNDGRAEAALIALWGCFQMDIVPSIALRPRHG